MPRAVDPALSSTGPFMSPELEEFRQRIIAHAKLAWVRAARVESEASTNASLVQPFLTALGYDVGNPDEVSPEHHADFSDKYQTRSTTRSCTLGSR